MHRRFAKLAGLLLLALAVSIPIMAADPPPTPTIYEGVLDQPLTAVLDFEFLLFDRPTGGVQIGTLKRPGVAVSHGRFSVPLDFGSLPCCADRFLETRVWEPTSNTFRILPTRQELTRKSNCDIAGNLYVSGAIGVGPVNSVPGALLSTRVTTGSGTHYLRMEGSTDTATMGLLAVTPKYSTTVGVYEGRAIIYSGDNPPPMKVHGLLEVHGVIASTGGFGFPDGTVARTAEDFRGPIGPQGPSGPPGPPVRTFAVCAVGYCAVMCKGPEYVMAESPSPCTVTSDTGSCFPTSQGTCCVCKPH